jgi:hypothetical protein
MANLVYNEFKKRLLGGTVVRDFIVMLMRPDYTPDPDTAAIDDGTPGCPHSHELSTGSVSGYQRWGLTNVVAGKDLTADIGYLDADDVAFGALGTGGTIGGAIVYVNTGVDTTNCPAMFYDLADTPTNGSNITLRWAAVAQGGILKAS